MIPVLLQENYADSRTKKIRTSTCVVVAEVVFGERKNAGLEGPGATFKPNTGRSKQRPYDPSLVT